MTENDLIQLDFTRESETTENSGSPNDWHYYTYDFGNGSTSLVSPASDEVKNDEWYVEFFGNEKIRFTSRTELEILMTLINNNCIN